MVIPHWKRHLFEKMTEKMLSELASLTEGELRSLRGELGRFEANHTFERESSKRAIRMFIAVVGALLLRI